MKLSLPSNFVINRFTNKGAFIGLNVGLSFRRIFRIVYGFWVWHMKPGEGKAACNFTNVNPSGSMFCFLNKIYFRVSHFYGIHRFSNVHDWITHIVMLSHFYKSHYKVPYL